MMASINSHNHSNIETVKMLINYGEDVHIKGDTRCTSLYGIDEILHF